MTRTRPAFDYSTINQTVLDELPQQPALPPGWKLQAEPGNGCFLDPPGYPSYFTQHIYTPSGNDPQRGATVVLLGHVTAYAEWPAGETWETHSARYGALLQSLYVPLPLDHPRVQAWISTLIGYFRHCYVDLSQPAATRRHVAQLAIFGADMLPPDPARFVSRAELDIREVYPEYTLPDPVPPGTYGSGGEWWERYAEPFTADTCPGHLGRAHRTDSWCQMCGLGARGK
jgi:hypothetical protein